MHIVVAVQVEMVMRASSRFFEVRADVVDVDPVANAVGRPAAINLRRDERHSTWQRVDVAWKKRDGLGELVDLSVSGARLILPTASAPLLREEVTLRLLDGTYLIGQVVWSADGRCGLRFDASLPSVEEFLESDPLGDDFYRAVLRSQARLRAGDAAVGWPSLPTF